MARIRLLVWNYNYSSWPMRAGLALRGTEAPFDEESVNDAAGPRPEVARLSPSGRFPLLLHGKVVVWDSLAIGGYLADLFPLAGLLPRDVVARARIRSICSEIHSRLANLRQELPMNIKRSGVQCTISDAAGTEVERAFDLVRERQRLWAGAASSILTEGLTLGDAFLAPLIMRFKSYGVPMPKDIQAYAGALLVYPTVKDWVTLADSSVICEYLDKKYPEPQLFPKGPQLRARARWLEEFADTRMGEVFIWHLFNQLVIRPFVWGEAPDEQVLLKAREEEIPQVLDYLEGELPLVGFVFGSICVADIALVSCFRNALFAGYSIDTERWPRTGAFVDLVLSHTSFQKLRPFEELLLRTSIPKHRTVLGEAGAPISAETLGTAVPRRGILTI